MPERHSSERVESLFAHLEAIERQLVDNQQAFLRALDDKYSASGLGALQDEAQALTRAAATIVREIESQVAGSSAREVFRRRPASGTAPAGEDTTTGSSGAGARSAMEALARLQEQRARDQPRPGDADVDVPL